MTEQKPRDNYDIQRCAMKEDCAKLENDFKSISKALDAAKAEIEQLKAEVRAYLMDAGEPTDRAQEAAHYNWLDDQNEELKEEIEMLRKVVRRMINRSNVVTAYYRHDQTISNESIVELYDAQIEAEEIMGEK